MKKSLTHLPDDKRGELRAVAGIITELIDAEFVILFGSYARGDWVEDVYVGDDGTTYEYKSDYDILVVVEDLPKYEYKGYRNRIKKRVKRSGKCQTRLSIIMHSVDEFKKELKSGSYFFTDIKKEGVLLHSSKRFRMPPVKELNAKQRRGKAELNFKNWFESAVGFYHFHEHGLKDNNFNGAAFQLHQAAERFYHTILLVFTDYKPKLHDLEDLEGRANRFCGKLKGIFPKNTDEEKRLFSLLKQAYTEARYNMAYQITKEELEYLATCVLKLQDVTKKICQEKIESML